MSAANLSVFARPNTATIFAQDPSTGSKIVAFLLKNTVFPTEDRVRLDLLRSHTSSSRAIGSRSPMEETIGDDIKLGPRNAVISGQLSATPIGGGASILGTLGSIVRRDLRELAKLKRLQALRFPVTLVTPSDIYTSMLFSIDEEHTGEHKVELTLSFEEFRIVSPLTVAGKLDLDEMLVGAGNTTDAGAQPTVLESAPPGLDGGLG